TVLLEDLVLHAHQHDLRRINHRAAADRDHQIGPGVAGLLRGLHHHLARRMLRDAVEGRGVAIAERFSDLLDLVGRGVQRPADNQGDALPAEPFALLAHRLSGLLAIDPGFHGGGWLTGRGADAFTPSMLFSRRVVSHAGGQAADFDNNFSPYAFRPALKWS